MKELRLPLLSSTSERVYPADRRCPYCGGDFSDGVAYLSGGALLLSEDGQDALQLDRLKAFLHLGFHGRDPEMHDSADLMVVDDVSAGQFDLQWCSVRCMRTWLNLMLDKLEVRSGPQEDE